MMLRVSARPSLCFGLFWVSLSVCKLGRVSVVYGLGQQPWDGGRRWQGRDTAGARARHPRTL